MVLRSLGFKESESYATIGGKVRAATGVLGDRLGKVFHG